MAFRDTCLSIFQEIDITCVLSVGAEPLCTLAQIVHLSYVHFQRDTPQSSRNAEWVEEKNPVSKCWKIRFLGWRVPHEKQQMTIHGEYMNGALFSRKLPHSLPHVNSSLGGSTFSFHSMTKYYIPCSGLCWLSFYTRSIIKLKADLKLRVSAQHIFIPA